MNKTTPALFAALCGFGLLSTAARADIVISGTPGGSGFVQITTDLTYKVTSNAGLHLIILDEWVSVPNTADQISGGLQFKYRINGGVEKTVGYGIYDNFNTTIGSVTPKDGAINFGATGAVMGDTITFPAQTIAFPFLPPGYNPQALGTFKGRTFLADTSYVRASADVFANRSLEYERQANEQFLVYSGMGQTNKALHHYYDNIALSLYYFYLDAGFPAEAEFNLYKNKGLSLKYLYMDQGKPKLGRYFQYLNLAIAHKKFWTFKGNPRKGQQLYVKYRKIALAARR